MRQSAVGIAAALIFSLSALFSRENPAWAQSYSGPIGFTSQAKIASTGQAIQLPATGKYVNGFLLCADDNNAAAGMTIGYSNSLTNVTDGTGNGFIMRPGRCVGLSNPDSSQLWANGTSGDKLSWIGN